MRLHLKESIGYFLGSEVDSLQASEADPLIAIDPQGARRIDVMFLFAHVPTLKELGFKDAMEPRVEKLEIQCEDQRGRTLVASTKYLAGMSAPK